MMVAPLVIVLGIASAAVCLNVNASEEIVKVFAGAVAVICTLLSLLFAPLILKLALLAVPFLGEKFNLFKFPG